MHINNLNQNQTNFGRLYTGLGTKKKLCDSSCSKDLVNLFINKRKAVWKSGINNLEFVDVILDYKDNIGYVLNIIKKSPKEWDFAKILDSFSFFSNTEEHVIKLKEWGIRWNNQVKESMTKI